MSDAKPKKPKGKPKKKTGGELLVISEPRAREKPGPRVGVTRSGVILDNELIERICTNVMEGQFASDAAVAEGVSHQTFSGWVKRGESEPDSIFGVLRAGLEYAEGLNNKQRVQTLNRQAQSDWKANAWFLAQRHAKWGPKVEPVPVVAAPTIDFSKLTDEELAAWRKLYAKAKPT